MITFLHTFLWILSRAPRDILHPKKCPVFKRGHLRNLSMNAAACHSLKSCWSTCQFFPKMLNTGLFFSCGGGAEGEGDISRYSTIIVRLEFPQSRKQNTNSTSVVWSHFKVYRVYVSHKRTSKAEKYFTVKVPPSSVPCTTHKFFKSCTDDNSMQELHLQPFWLLQSEFLIPVHNCMTMTMLIIRLTSLMHHVHAC